VPEAAESVSAIILQAKTYMFAACVLTSSESVEIYTPRVKSIPCSTATMLQQHDDHVNIRTKGQDRHAVGHQTDEG